MKKNTKTAYILLSITAMLVTVFVAVSLTIAWYVSKTSAELTSISIESAGITGIQISGDAQNWKQVLTTRANPPDININQDTKIDSISTTGKVVAGKLQFYQIAIDEYGEYQTKLHTSESLYYHFDFYIRNNDTNIKQLLLGYNSSVEDDNGKELHLSTRIAFVNLGNAESPQDARSLQGEGVERAHYIWEPNSTSRSQRIQLYKEQYLLQGKASYRGVNQEAQSLFFEDGVIVNPPDSEKEFVSMVDTYDPINAGNSSKITQIKPASITKLRVYIWCEGQDIDCNNSVSGGTANITLSFNSYDLFLDENGNFIAKERFLTPTLSQESPTVFSWEPVATNVSSSTYSIDYLVLIQKSLESETIFIKAILTNQLSLDTSTISLLQSGEYFLSVKAISTDFGDSDYSNSVAFLI